MFASSVCCEGGRRRLGIGLVCFLASLTRSFRAQGQRRLAKSYGVRNVVSPPLLCRGKSVESWRRGKRKYLSLGHWICGTDREPSSLDPAVRYVPRVSSCEIRKKRQRVTNSFRRMASPGGCMRHGCKAEKYPRRIPGAPLDFQRLGGDLGSEWTNGQVQSRVGKIEHSDHHRDRQLILPILAGQRQGQSDREAPPWF